MALSGNKLLDMLEAEGVTVQKVNTKTSTSKNTSAKKTSGNTVSASSLKGGNSFTSNLLDAMADVGAPIYTQDDIAPVKKTTTTTKKKKKDEEEDDRKWFQKGAFEDGYQFGDVFKTLLGTATDVAENVGAGVIGMGEKALDAIAYVSPLLAQGQYYQNGGVYHDAQTQKMFNESIEEGKKWSADFIKKDLYDEEKIAKKIVAGTDDNSVLGKKSDALLQSGGQLLATAGLQAVGVPWFLTTGATSFGSQAEIAMNDGAGYEEAGLSAAVSAGAEILTEKLSGGIKFGGKTLDDVLLKPLTEKIANKAVKTLVNLGVDAVGEGAEEVVSGVLGNLGTAIYKEDDVSDLLFSEQAMDEYLESFIGGAVLGGIGSGVQAIQDNKRIHLTENEQKVVEHEVEKRTEGQTLTEKEKNKIRNEVVRDMLRGYISTDTIEEVLGGETYQSWKNTVDSEDALRQEYEELGKKQNATLAEQTRYNELHQQLKDLKTTSRRNALKDQLGSEVMSLIQNDRLAESYNERSRRGQAYQADISQYDEKQRATIQKAIDSGILNNTNRTHEFVDMIAKITADKGVLFDFTNNEKLKESGFAVDGKAVNGYVTKDGVVLNIDSAKNMNSVVGHEITHVLEGTELYRTLQNTVFEYANGKGDYQSRYDALAKLYEGVEGADINAELTADLVGDYLFTDTEFVRNLSVQHRNVFQKIYDEVKYLYKVATAGSKEARELEKVKRAFEEAYNAGGKQQTEGETAATGVRFSLSDPVEQAKNLVAVHNLSPEKLTKSLALGGLPMPSIAILKAQDGHGEFGDISLVFGRDTVDPQAYRTNKIYSGDAWTPTYPSIEYKPSDKVLKAVKNKISGLVPYEVQNALGNLMFDADNARDTLNRYDGNMAEAYKRDDAMKYAYLKDTGSDISLPVKEADLYAYGGISNEAVRYFSGKLVNGLQTVEHYQNMGARAMMQDEALKEAIADAMNWDVLRTLEPGSAEYTEYENDPVFRAEEVSFSDIDKMLAATRKLFTRGVQQTVDRKAAKDLIRDSVDQAAYENWLNDLFEGVVEKEGIRNNKDLFTSSGNRRSFEALHYEHNLENVIKAMREKGSKGLGGFGNGNIFGAATQEFSSIEQMKQSDDRLQHLSEEEFEAIKKDFSDRFFEIASSLPNDKKSFIATDDAANMLIEAVTKYSTKSGMANYLRKESQGWATYSDHVVDDLMELVGDIRSMPTGYFEAKPQRAVGFDEVEAVLVPDNLSEELSSELARWGFNVVTYEAGNDADRAAKLNELDDLKFSLSNVGEEANADSLSALKLEAAPVSNAKPNAEVVSNANSNAPIANESVRELFPDDALAPIADDPERFDSLDDADAPPVRVSEAGEQASPVTMTKEAVGTIAKTVTDNLYVGNRQVGSVHKLISDYAKQEFPDKNWLFQQLKDNYGSHTEKYADETTQEVKAALRKYRLNVSDEIKGDIADYNDLRRHNFGKVLFSRQGTAVDSAYEELSAMYPGFFPSDIINPTDQLLQIVNVANMDATTEQTYEIDDETIWDVTNDIAEMVSDYQHIQNEQAAQRPMPKGSVDDLVANAERYAPATEDIAPVAETKQSAPMKAPTAVKAEAIRPKRQTTGPKLARATPAEQARMAQESQKVARVLTEEPKVDPKKPKAWNLFKDNVVDKGTVFETMSLKSGNRELQGKWKAIGRAEGSAQWFMEHGSGKTKSLKSIKDAVEKSGKTKKFSEYLYHMHNVDRMNLEDRFSDVLNKPVFGYGVTSDMSKVEAARLEKANPEFKRWAQDVYAYNKAQRQMLVDNGVISKETAELWEKMYPHYVPVRRVGDEGLNINVALDSNKTGVNAPVKRATGGNRDILPLFDTMAMRTEQTFKAIAKNRFGVELKNMLGTTIDTGEVSVDEMIDSVDMQDSLLQEGKDGNSPTFTVFENGERVTFEITEEMYDTMKPKGKLASYTNKVANTANNIRRGLLTEYNPAFMLTNPIKDMQDVLMNSQHPARTYANVPKAIGELLGRNGQYYQEYMEHGGEQNTFFDGETKTFAEEKSGLSKAIGFPLEAISKVNNFIERVPRMAEYIASRKMGRSIDVSMLDAARVTTDFSAGGDAVKMLNRNGFTFLNASVQGAVQQVRNVREAKAEGIKGWAKLAAKTAVAGLSAELLNHLLWEDDEDYEDLSDYVKQNYYVVAKYDDGKFVRIPKGRTVAVIQDAFEQMKNLITGDDETDFGAFAELVISNLAPNNPLENNLIAPIMQTINNETWYGDELVPSRLQDLPAAEQYDETTDSISKWLGEKTNISPYKLNYLLDQYSGAIGDMFLPMLTPEAERGNDDWWGDLIAPISDKFTTDSVLKNQNVTDFYDKRDELEVISNGRNATKDDELRKVFVDAVSWEMSDLYAQKREIQNSDMSDSEKYEAVRELQKKIDALAESGLNGYENVYSDGAYAEVGDRRFNYDKDKDTWYEIKKKNSDGSDNWYYTQEQLFRNKLGVSYSDYWNGKFDPAKDHVKTHYGEMNGKRYNYSEENNMWYEIRQKNDDGSDNWYYQKEQEVTKALGLSYPEYWDNREEYNFAYDHPQSYALAKSIGGYKTYMPYYDALENWQSDNYIASDKDANGDTIYNSRKKKVQAYLKELDIPEMDKLLLYKSQYNSYDDRNYEIIDYLNSNDDLTFEDRVNALRGLGFDVTDDGYISWK